MIPLKTGRFPARSFFERAKMQTARNMLNRQNQPKKHTIPLRAYAKSKDLRLLAYGLPLQEAQTGARRAPKPLNRMLNCSIQDF